MTPSDGGLDEGRRDGWRVVREMHSVGGITATGPDDAWVLEYLGKGRYEFERWDGTSWAQVELPRDLGDTGPMGSSAPDNVWLIAEETSTRKGHEAQSISVRWDGRRFICSTIGIYTVEDLAVLGPRDVWAVGYRYYGFPSKTGPRTPYAMRWNGKRWHKVPTPKHLAVVAAVSGSDIWALREVSQFAADGLTFWHWDGESWGPKRTPPIVPPPGAGLGSGELYDLTALPSGDVWAAGRVGWWKPSDSPFDEESPERSKSLLLHWDGHRWSSFLGQEGERYWTIAPDGAGGVWMTTDEAYVHHAQDGAVSRVPYASYQLQPSNERDVADLANVPGTTSMLAATEPDDAPGGLGPVLEAYRM